MIMTSMGVGSNPLHGLLIWGQFEITQSTSISAFMSTKFPSPPTPSTMARPPLSSRDTFIKKLRLATTSRFDIPYLARLGDGRLRLADGRVERVEDLRNPPLLGERREIEGKLFELLLVEGCALDGCVRNNALSSLGRTWMSHFGQMEE
jgi:hypothetical protein